MQFLPSYPLLAYTGPEPRQHRIYLANLAKNERQICIDLGKDCYELVDFFDMGSDQPSCPKDLAEKWIYLLVRDIKSRKNEYLSISMDPWNKDEKLTISKIYEDTSDCL